MKLFSILFALLALTLLPSLSAPARAQVPSPLANAVILIIRHAEKPLVGDTLTLAGEQRAQFYVHYFQNYKVDSQPLHLDYLFAAKDSKSSMRPRLSLEPLSHATGLKIDDSFKNKDYQELADSLQSTYYGKHILICWHHEEIANLLRALGADPATLLPGGKWSGDQYAWVLEIHYDKNGRLIPSESRCINDGFTPTASAD